jgi:hypothetical protein
MSQNTAAALNPRGAQIEPEIVLMFVGLGISIACSRHDSGERTLAACWLRRFAATNFPAIRFSLEEKVRDGVDAIASTLQACAPRTLGRRFHSNPAVSS